MQKTYRSRPRDEVAERIECYIVEQGLQPHAQLPSERKLCEMWDLNRATLRSAIRKLIVEGKLYSHVGSGTYVSPPKFRRNLQDMETLGEAARREGRALETRVLYAEVIECTKQLSQKMKLRLGHKILALQRLRMLEGVPAVLELTYLDAELCKGIEKKDYGKVSLYNTLRQDYGLSLKSGRESVGLTYTTAQEGDLLGIPEDTAVFFISGRMFTEDGSCVEYFKSLNRADIFQFQSVLVSSDDVDTIKEGAGDLS